MVLAPPAHEIVDELEELREGLAVELLERRDHSMSLQPHDRSAPRPGSPASEVPGPPLDHAAGCDAVVVGAGPNGLAAAITLAEAGQRVLLLEGNEEVGGGARSAELTLPGYLHDRCSAVHPLARGSRVMRQWLDGEGLRWIDPELPLAHPLDDGAVAVARSVDETASGLGVDGAAYRRLLGPLASGWEELAPGLLGPLPWNPALWRHPLASLRLGWVGLRSAASLCRALRTGPARALLAGIAAHSQLPLERAPSAAVALLLGAAAHAVGWPFPRGGAGRISLALAARLRELGGGIRTGFRVRALDQLPPHRVALMDLTPRQLLEVAGSRLPPAYRRRLAAYRHGPGSFKLDWALRGPIPWRNEACRRAGTVHLGGSFEEIAAAERSVWAGEHAERPFVIVAQPSLFDSSRAPAGGHVGWAYCHVPGGSGRSMTAAIEAQVERFAPGFRELILARHESTAQDLERENPNYVGGDINGGVLDLRQTLARPIPGPDPYATPLPSLFLCSSATPPGGGVHGMCGWHAARSALRRLGRRPTAWGS